MILRHKLKRKGNRSGMTTLQGELDKIANTTCESIIQFGSKMHPDEPELAFTEIMHALSVVTHKTVIFTSAQCISKYIPHRSAKVNRSKEDVFIERLSELIADVYGEAKSFSRNYLRDDTCRGKIAEEFV